MNKKKGLWISIPFLIIIFGFAITNVIAKDRESSVSENRTLKQLPSLKDGNFTGEFESYYADQFVLRDEFLKLYTKSQILSNKTKVRDYFVYEDKWILESPDVYIEDSKIKESTEIINKYAKELSESGKDVYYISTPYKTNVLKYMYPKYIDSNISTDNKDRFLANLNKDYMTVVDLSKDFTERFDREKLESLYFKTDHHWNSLGAYEGFKTIVESINKNSNENIEIKDEDYDTYVLNNKPFSGSYNLNLYQVISKDEEVPYVYRKGSENYELRKSYDGTWFAPTETREVIARFVNEDELTYAGSYTYDDHYYQLLNPNALTDKKVLVIRDSYNAAMSWLLADIFKEVEVVDPRHTAAVNLTSKEIIDRSSADVVLFMYNDLSATGVIPELNK